MTQSNTPALNSLLGKNVKNISVSNFKYTAEMVDSGYIYAMVKRKKGFEWMGYIVNDKGHLSYFPVDKKAPTAAPDFACKGNEHDIFSSFVTVEYIASNLAEKLYIVYTHAPMTDARRKEYQEKADQYVIGGKWQSVDVAGWIGGKTEFEHCLNHTRLGKSVFNPSSFGSDRWGKIVKKFSSKPNAYTSTVLYDPIGITVKLNEYRNEAYIPVDDFLEAKDINGVSNQRRLDAVHRLDTLKSSLAQRTTQYHTTREMDTRISIDGRLQGQLLTIDELSRAAQKRGDTKEVARLEQRKREVLKENAELINKREQNKQSAIEDKTQADFQVCDKNLSYSEAESFKKLASKKYETALNVANQRAQQHLNWLNSNSLHNALDIYDQKDLQSGCAFKAHIACMLFGMEGATASAKQIDEWIKAPEFVRKNLFIRGLYSNQLEAKAKHDEVKNTAIDLTAVGIKTTKMLVDFLKKTDSAWDEWVRNQDKNNTWNVKFFKPERTVMLYVSNFSRVIFRAGMGTSSESRFVKSISQKLLFAQMGELASKLEFNQVVYGVDPEKLTGGKVTSNPDFNNKVTGMLSGQAAKQATMQSLDRLIDDAMVKKHQVALTLEQIEEIGSKGMNNHTNNYHQVRASGALVLIEAVNLAHMLKSGKYQDATQITALVASVSALMAFGLDIFYGLAKGAREVANQTSYGGAGAAATRGAANIQRAGIKWAAGGLSSFAGAITAILDFKKASTEYTKTDSLWGLYLSRGVTGLLSSALGGLAALTYIGPLMSYLKNVGASPAIQRLGAKFFGASAMLVFKNTTREVVRNALLRGIAWASGVGLILTIIEFSILIYMESTKLKRWCDHSTFRKIKTNKLMSENQEAEDYQALFA